VAVVLSEPIEEGFQVQSPLTRFEQNPLLQPLVRMRVAQAFNVFIEAIMISSTAMTDYRLKVDKPEVIIRPNVAHVHALDTADIPDLARRGEEAAWAAMPALHEAVSPLSRLRTRLRNRRRK